MIAALFFLVLFILVQWAIERQREIQMPQSVKLEKLDTDFTKVPIPQSPPYYPMEVEAKTVNSPLMTDGRYIVAFPMHDFVWLGRIFLLLNSGFFGYFSQWLFGHGMHPILTTILALLIIGQIWFWVYQFKVPVKTIVFDVAEKAVYVPRFVENPEQFVAFSNVQMMIKKSVLDTKVQLYSKVIKKEPNKIKFKSDKDNDEASCFTLSYQPPSIIFLHSSSKNLAYFQSVLQLMNADSTISDISKAKRNVDFFAKHGVTILEYFTEHNRSIMAQAFFKPSGT